MGGAKKEVTEAVRRGVASGRARTVVVQVAEHVPRRVAQLAVRVGRLLDDRQFGLHPLLAIVICYLEAVSFIQCVKLLLGI